MHNRAVILVSYLLISLYPAMTQAKNDPVDQEPGAYLRRNVRPSPCQLPTGARFVSVEELDSGIGPSGPQKGRWTVKFDRGRFTWSFSDMAVTGRFACDGGDIAGSALSGSWRGVFDRETGRLEWAGHFYEITGRLAKKYRKPARQDTPAPSQPAPPEVVPSQPQNPADFESRTRIEPLGRTEEERRGCAANDDCVITCDVDGSCCGTPCGCSSALNRDFARRLVSWKAARCAGKGQHCPAVGCMMRGPFFATCENGLCESHDMERVGTIVR